MSEHPHNHTKSYIKVWLALMVLTGLTVLTAKHEFFDYGEWNIVLAMAIATVKAMLVMLIFMHLKDDTLLNKVVFGSSFVFLALFIGFTLLDHLDRTPVVNPRDDLKVEKIMSKDQKKQMEQLCTTAPSDALLAKGKSIYQDQCATCHGESGKGDGPGGQALNPKPRNFTAADGWINGPQPSAVYATLMNGLNAMPQFPTLSIEERWAVSHYVRTFMKNPPKDTAATFQMAGFDAQGKLGGGPAKAPELPIEFAIDRILQENK